MTKKTSLPKSPELMDAMLNILQDINLPKESFAQAAEILGYLVQSSDEI